MATTVQSIVDKLSDQLLNDSDNTRWSETELVAWVNEAQLVITSLVSDAQTTTELVLLSAGSRQNLTVLNTNKPVFRLIDITRAYDGASSTTLRRVQRLYINVVQRAFYGADATDLVKDWFFDPSNPLEFEVYPPATTFAQVELVYNPYPDTVAIGDNIDIADHYAHSIVDYVAFRAFSKDTEDVSPDLGRATAFYNNFAISVGLRDIGDTEHEPRKVDP